MLKHRNNLHPLRLITILLSFFILQNTYPQADTQDIQVSDLTLKELFGMSLHDLMNFEITTASKKEEKISKVPASVIVITRDDIEKYGYTTLTEVLENVPGLYNINDWQAYGDNFGIRGFWTDNANHNIIFLLNGVKQNDDYANSTILPLIPISVEDIDRIEVVRGPLSVQYGSGAFFGAINIITNESSANLITGSYGKNNTKKAAVRFADETDVFKYAFNASYYRTDGSDENMSKMMDGADFKSGGLMGEQQSYFNFSGRFKEFYVDIGLVQVSDTKPFLIAPNNYTDHHDLIDATRACFGYTKKLSGLVTLDSRISYHQIQRNADYGFGLFSKAWMNSWEHQISQSRAFETELNAFIAPSDKIDVTVGLNYHSAYEVNTIYDLPLLGSNLSNNEDGLHDNIVTYAAYAQTKYKMSERMLLVAGLRLEQVPEYKLFSIRNGGSEQMYYGEASYNYEDISAIPRFAAIYSLNESNVFKFLYGEAINRPPFASTRDLAADSLMEALEPEIIKTLEFNYSAVVSSRITVSFSLFNNRLKNLIARKTGFDENGKYFSRYANCAEMTTNGGELQIQVLPVEKMLLDLAVTCQKTKDIVHKDIDVSYSPRFLGYIKAKYNFNKNLSAAFTGHYVDKMYPMYDWTLQDITDQTSPPIGYIGKQVDSYFNLNANLRMENFLSNGFFVDLRAVNLLNTEIHYPTVINQAWATKGTLGMGRGFFISVGKKF